MKKFLLLIMCLYAGASAYAQMATTTEAGNDGTTRLISNDQRKIHFGSVAKKLYADLNPDTHKKEGYNFGTEVYYKDFAGYSDENNQYHEATCSYTYSNGVGTFSSRNNRKGNAAVNLLDNLKGNLGDYENFVIRTLSVSSPREGQSVTITTNGEGSHAVEQSARYALQFCDEWNTVIRQAIIYSNDVKVIPLHEFFSDDQISNIESVWISTCGGDPFLDADVQIAEAYFISAYNMNDESYFKDMDGNYIGNAYVHPSYFICSNNVTLDEATGVITVGEPGAQSYQSANLDASMFKSWNGVDANATSTGDAECLNNIGTSETNVYGDAGVYYLNYADLSDYDRLTIVTGSENEIPRLLFNRQTDNGAYLEVADPASNYVTQDNNKFVIDLAAIKADKGYVHLNAIKGANWQSITVSSMIVEKLNALNKQASLQLSVPFDGFDMTDITVVTFDNEEDGDVIYRNVYGHMDYDKLGNVKKGETSDIDLANENINAHDVRTLYNSRYNADFQVDQANSSYANKINNIYWETNFSGTTNPIGTMTVNDICFTKNHVVVRNGGNHTLLSKALYHQYGADGNIVDEKPIFYDQDFVEIGTTVSGDAATLFGCGTHMQDANYADLSKYYKMQIKGTAGTELRIIANLNNGAQLQKMVRLDSKGLANLDIKEIVKAEGFFHLNGIKTPWGSSGTATIDYIKLYADEDGVVELNEDLFHTWNRAVNGTVTRLEAFGGKEHGNSNHHLVNKIGTEETLTSGDVIFGNDASKFYKEDYAELTGYKKIKVTGTPGLSVRIVYNVSQNEIWENGVQTQNCILKDNNLTIGSGGTAEMDIRDYVYFHLNGIKVGWGSSGTVSKVELISDERVDYVLEGNGTLSTTDDEAKAYADGGKNGNIGTNAMAALNDVGARVIDARPRVSISRTDLAYPANPNCLIIMRENLSKQQDHRKQFNTPSKDGMPANMMTFDGLTRDDYKIGETKVDFLRLFDGYPFSAPRTFTAVGGAYLQRKTTANVIGTLILPFDCNVNGDGKVGAYNTTTAEYAEFDTEKQGILENVDINKGDHVLLFEKITGDAKAYHPYLYVANETNANSRFTSWGETTITQTPECGSADAPAEYMTNEREAGEEDRHYLRGFMESTHVENVYAYTGAGNLIAATNATMNPFRVLIQAPKNILEDRAAQATSAPVKVVLASAFDDADVTAIESVETLDPERNVDVFSVNGALVKKNVKAADALQSLPKGVYVVGGKKIVK